MLMSKLTVELKGEGFSRVNGWIESKFVIGQA